MAQVMIVSTDRIWCQRFAEGIRATPDVSVICSCQNLMDAYHMAEQRVPDIALVSQDFTVLPEFEMILAVFAALNIRWLSISAHGSGSKVRTQSNRELRSGLFMIESADHIDRSIALIRSLCHNERHVTVSRSSAVKAAAIPTRTAIVLLGSSTGGVEALSTILGRCPQDCLPTLIVQHTGAGYGRNLVKLLSRICPAEVVQAEEGLLLAQGMVCVAAGIENHVTITRSPSWKIRMQGSTPQSGHLPSIDAMFESAVPYARSVIAGVLTGMGRDGAKGLLALRDESARTFAQDKRSSVVYGMPRAAWELGAAEVQLPLGEIANHIKKLGRRTKEVVK